MAGVTVVFDLDGTLVDTAPDLVETLNVVFAREGLPSVPFELGRASVSWRRRQRWVVAVPLVRTLAVEWAADQIRVNPPKPRSSAFL